MAAVPAPRRMANTANLKASFGGTYPSSAGETRVKASERRATWRRALVATYGVASRSALITWSSVERNVISPLQAGSFSVTVFSFDLRIGSSRIDGVNACRSSNVVRCNVCEVDEQARLDLELAHKMNEFRLREPRSHHLFSICSGPWARRQYTGTGMSCFNNSLRQLHMENRVAAHLRSNGARYDVAVALSVDYYVVMPIRLEHVREAASANASSNATVYVTSVNDSGGHTDRLRSSMEQYAIVLPWPPEGPLPVQAEPALSGRASRKKGRRRKGSASENSTPQATPMASTLGCHRHSPV